MIVYTMGHTIRLPKVTHTIHLSTVPTIISVVSEAFLLINRWKNLITNSAWDELVEARN